MQNAALVPNRTDDDFMLADQAIAAILPTTNRLGIAHANIVKRLHHALADMAALKAAGANEAEVGLIVNAVQSFADTLFGGHALTDEHTAKRMELDADVAEDHVEGVIAIEGENPSLLEMHADALEKQASTSRVRARFLRRRARQIRTTRTGARQRIGVA